MRRHAAGRWSDSTRALAWMKANDPLRRAILRQIRKEGPLPSRAFEGPSSVGWRTTGWNNERNGGMMLFFLARSGQLMVDGRQDGQMFWGFCARRISDGTPQTILAAPAIVSWAAANRLRAVGAATTR